MSISVAGTGMITNNGVTTISGKLSSKIEDDGGHTGSVQAQVALIAVLDTENAPTDLIMVDSFTSGSNSSAVTVYSGPTAQACMLTGFSMAYSGNDENINQIGANVTFGTNAPPSVTLTGTSILAESSKTQAGTLSLSGAILNDTNSPSLFVTKTVTYASGTGSVSVTFDQKLASAQAFLVGFNAQYPGTDTHKVKQVLASYSYFFSPAPTSQGLSTDGHTFYFTSPGPEMKDDSGNYEATSTSSATYVIVGVIDNS